MTRFPILSVVVPAYNEQARIGACLDACFDYLPRHVQSWELIVVDDGSADDTWRVLERYKGVYSHLNIVRNTHAGKGRAVRTGMLWATGEYRLFMDADLSTPLEEIGHALEAIARADVVIGSRELDRSRVRATLMRRVMGRVFHALAGGLVDGVQDTQCGFKMFRDYAAKDIFEDLRLDGFAFDVEALFLAQRKGYTVVEMPVRWEHAEGSKVRVINSSLEMLFDLMRIQGLHNNQGVRATGDL